MSKLERLLNLTAVLLHTERPMSAEQIRQKVAGYPPAGTAFHRAFERDKEDLRELGIPLMVERVPATDPPQDGYRINPDDYYLPDPELEPAELAALHIASMTVRVDGLDDGEALWKLGGLGEREAGEPMVASLPSNPALVPVFGAISKSERITFTYNDQQREFDPWRLDFRRGRWYMSGFDHSRDAERSFRLDRIAGSIEVTGQATTAPDVVEDNASARKGWEFGDSKPIDVHLHVDAHLVDTVAHQLGSKATRQDNDDASAVFTVPVSNREAFRTFALMYLEHVEILSPPDVRQDFVQWLERFEVTA